MLKGVQPKLLISTSGWLMETLTMDDVCCAGMHFANTVRNSSQNDSMIYLSDLCRRKKSSLQMCLGDKRLVYSFPDFKKIIIPTLPGSAELHTFKPIGFSVMLLGMALQMVKILKQCKNKRGPCGFLKGNSDIGFHEPELAYLVCFCRGKAVSSISAEGRIMSN